MMDEEIVGQTSIKHLKQKGRYKPGGSSDDRKKRKKKNSKRRIASGDSII